MEIQNRKARFNYFIEKTYEAYIINMYIAKYEEGNRFNHDERRNRKLLLHKNEIKKLSTETNNTGYTIVPIKLYFKGNYAKIEIGLARGKKLYDKREAIKKRDLEREAKR